MITWFLDVQHLLVPNHACLYHSRLWSNKFDKNACGLKCFIGWDPDWLCKDQKNVKLHGTGCSLRTDTSILSIHGLPK